MKRFMLLLTTGFLFVGAVFAQTSASVVKVSAGAPSYAISKGGSAAVQVVLEIQNGFHVNSNRPSDEFLIATSLKLETPEGLSTTRVVYPPGKMKRFKFSPKALSVYEGRVVLRFQARASASAASGNHTIRGKLTVQACNDEACLRPQTVNVDVPVQVVD